MEHEPQRNEWGQPVEGWSPRPHPPRTVMAGRFATVEPLDPDRHAAELFDANSEDCEGRLWTYYNFGPFTTLPEYRAWLDAACAIPDRLYHAIRDNAQGQAVGVAVYQNWVPAMGTVEIGGLVFSPRLQRRPAATEAMYLMMRRGQHRQVSREQAWWSRVGQVNGQDDDTSRPNLRRLSIPC
jgi:RimJ/RimL family protein N-acetyltransferase